MVRNTTFQSMRATRNRCISKIRMLNEQIFHGSPHVTMHVSELLPMQYLVALCCGGRHWPHHYLFLYTHGAGAFMKTVQVYVEPLWMFKYLENHVCYFICVTSLPSLRPSCPPEISCDFFLISHCRGTQNVPYTMARTFIGSVVASLLISHLSAVHAASCPTSTFNLQATNLNITSINNKYGVLNPTDAWDGKLMR